jgi:hypothetical protein
MVLRLDRSRSERRVAREPPRPLSASATLLCKEGSLVVYVTTGYSVDDLSTYKHFRRCYLMTKFPDEGCQLHSYYSYRSQKDQSLLLHLQLLRRRCEVFVLEHPVKHLGAFRTSGRELHVRLLLLKF